MARVVDTGSKGKTFIWNKGGGNVREVCGKRRDDTIISQLHIGYTALNQITF